MQEVQDLLTENQVIEGVQNFLYQKGHTGALSPLQTPPGKNTALTLFLSWRTTSTKAIRISLKQRAT